MCVCARAPACVCAIRQRLRYKGRESERNGEVSDRETVMSTPVESDKRDRGRASRHNESSSMEVACGRDGDGEGRVEQDLFQWRTEKATESELDHRKWSV